MFEIILFIILIAVILFMISSGWKWSSGADPGISPAGILAPPREILSAGRAATELYKPRKNHGKHVHFSDKKQETFYNRKGQLIGEKTTVL